MHAVPFIVLLRLERDLYFSQLHEDHWSFVPSKEDQAGHRVVPTPKTTQAPCDLGRQQLRLSLHLRWMMKLTGTPVLLTCKAPAPSTVYCFLLPKTPGCFLPLGDNEVLNPRVKKTN